MVKNYIIAEIGINHEGKNDYIKKLIKSAKKSGCNAVKFQLFQPETMANKYSKIKKAYFKKNKIETLYKMWERLALDKKKINLISKLCKFYNIDLGFSVFDKESLNLLKQIKFQFLKVASSDINDFPLLKEFKNKNKHIIISTGMSNENDIGKIVKFFKKEKISVLHCVSLYPCPDNLVNLKRMIEIKKKYKISIGYSDHSKGVNACILAINLGAEVIEKHFTINKKLQGPDHALSADERDMEIICDYSNKFKKLYGSGKIRPTQREMKISKIARKSIYVRKKIFKDEVFNTQNLIIRRPSGNFSPEEMKIILNKKSLYDLEPGLNIEKKHLKK
jgi:N,N'-diacetyllegionaminate synthase